VLTGIVVAGSVTVSGNGEAVILYSGPEDVTPPGRDVVAWRWNIQGHRLVVEISATAMEAPDAMLPERTARARETRGESEVMRFLDWEVPPDKVSLHTDETIEGGSW
jgi:hypothetical protein